MRFALKLLAVLVVGTALGVAATWLSVYRFPPSRISDGPWKTNLLAGGEQSGPYRHAAVAIRGLFAQSRSESAYNTASTDSDGGALDGHCRYDITGREPEARWWSCFRMQPNENKISHR